MKGMTGLEKVVAVIEGRLTVGGLEISDSSLRYVVQSGRTWKTESVRLAPGVIEVGQVKDKEKCIEALKVLHGKIVGRRHRKKVGVVVTVSSLSVYSQVFNLPYVQGENIDEAIQLNLQMASPAEASEAYAGWQILSKNESLGQLEILSAYATRSIIDVVNEALTATGFLVVATEFRALSLARVVREQAEGVDPKKAYTLVHIDDTGLDFLIVRNGQLYFEYFNSWRDLAKGRYVPVPEFEAVIVRNLNRVLNYYAQHWSQALSDILVVATGLQPEIEKIVKDNFPLTIQHLTLPTSLGSEWLVATGGALRGLMSRRDDEEISLAGVEAQEEFRREELTRFAHFWRVAIPLAMGILVALFLVADNYLLSIKSPLDAQLKTISSGSEQQEFEKLQSEATVFNAKVAFVKNTRNAVAPKNPLLQKMMQMTIAQNVIIDHFIFPGYGVTLSLAGEASTKQQILDFKKALENEGHFKSVSLPITAIKQVPQGFAFTMTFVASPPSAS